jgi:hypothetical protein
VFRYEVNEFVIQKEKSIDTRISMSHHTDALFVKDFALSGLMLKSL